MQLPADNEQEASGLHRLTILRPERSDGKGQITEVRVKWPGQILVTVRTSLIANLVAKARATYPKMCAWPPLADAFFTIQLPVMLCL